MTDFCSKFLNDVIISLIVRKHSFDYRSWYVAFQNAFCHSFNCKDVSVLNKKCNSSCFLPVVGQPDWNPRVIDVTDSILLISMNAEVLHQGCGGNGCCGCWGLSCFCLSPGCRPPLHCGGSGTASCSRLPMWQGWAGTENRGITFMNRWDSYSPWSCSVLIDVYPLLPWTDALEPDNLLVSCILKGERHQLSWRY